MQKLTLRDLDRQSLSTTSGLMTGTQVHLQSMWENGESQNFSCAVINFSAGSRNKFHKHADDQILVITQGTGKVATDDGVINISEGDVILIPAGENHWHGAPDDTSMAHITITVYGSPTEQTEP